MADKQVGPLSWIERLQQGIWRFFLMPLFILFALVIIFCVVSFMVTLNRLAIGGVVDAIADINSPDPEGFGLWIITAILAILIVIVDFAIIYGCLELIKYLIKKMSDTK